MHSIWGYHKRGLNLQRAVIRGAVLCTTECISNWGCRFSGGSKRGHSVPEAQ